MADSTRFNFTLEALAGLKLPEGKSWVYYRDAKTTGLTIGVGPSGIKTFYLYRKISGRPERIRLGAYPALTIANARAKAGQLNATVEIGGNPSDLRRKIRGEPNLEELFRAYIKKYAIPYKLKTVDDMEANFRRYHSKFAAKKLSEIEQHHVEREFQRLGKEIGHTTANRFIELGRAFVNWGIRKKFVCGDNPYLGIRKFPTTSRDRFLFRSEMPIFIAAVEQEPKIYRDFFLILLLTGVRRGNLQAMQFSALHLEEGLWRLDGDETKNTEAQYVRLPPQAVQILAARKLEAPVGSQYVFSAKTESGYITSPKKSWARILARSGLTNLRPHDLRRTLATWQLAAGATLHEVGHSLNHKDIKSTMVYAKFDLSPIKQNVDRATAEMMSLTSDALPLLIDQDADYTDAAQ